MMQELGLPLLGLHELAYPHIAPKISAIAIGEHLLSLKHPPKRKILYLGDPRPGRTSGYRMESLRRIGQEVSVFDVTAYTSGSPLVSRLRQRYPVGPLVAKINRELLRSVRENKPDVVFFDKPIYYTRATIEELKRSGAQTICFNQDNPFGPRNDGIWRQFYKVFRLFDLHCLFREADVVRYRGWGLNFIKTMFSYDPAMQFPAPDGWSDKDRTREVSYIGSPLEDRPAFLVALAEEKKIPVVLAGPRWNKFLSPERYARYVTAGHLSDGDYRENIWRSKINLGFVSHQNEDDIGHKSIEIAACGSFLLAVRSEGHQECFVEDQEAVFFGSLDECAEKARFYLDHPELRETIARCGRERVVRSGYDNDTQLSRVLNRLDGVGD
jgi:spore maturation protein CgeB